MHISIIYDIIYRNPTQYYYVWLRKVDDTRVANGLSSSLLSKIDLLLLF